jgi:valyl-tRNA synthetase
MNNMELEKAYDPNTHEQDLYQAWTDSGYFNPDNLPGERTEPFALMMPPPNVTGVLHLGHALENSLMDIMIRYQRMQGKKALLVPGTDHAAIATQAKVEKMLMAEGMTHPREELGREALVEKIREFANDSMSTILNQVKTLGTSCDWSRLAYTFDEDRSKAVNELFIKMYNDGLIYRGSRVVNWSVKGQSTCSDDEVEHVERQAKLYYFKYSKDFPITIATTRPETKLGDTAVAVHPEGKWKEYIGQTFTIENFGQEGHPLTIKVIGDETIEDDFGTGALGVTTAHSQIDFEIYMKQKALGNDIGLIQVIDESGCMTAEAGSEYEGLPVEEAREKVVAWLEAEGLLEQVEEITQNVTVSDRYKDIIEAIPKTQWWLDVNKTIPSKGKTLRDLMEEAVTSGLGGDENKKVTITPDRFTKLYLNRVRNLRDWCLSRQIWWGHRIPAWYREDELVVSKEQPEGDGWVQDEDSLDTWFSSGTWTFSTLGWPGDTEDLKTYHPTAWMQMGYEILYLWLMRMILTSTYLFDDIPFKNAYIHGMLRDKHGDKFSKSAGNGIDPIDVINEYGADALRWSLIAGVTPGNDSRFYMEKVESAKFLVNKLWNMSRFMLMQIDQPTMDATRPEPQTDADRWILGELDRVIAETTEKIDQYDFSLAAEKLREFTWGDLADWYLEIAKIEGDKSAMLNYILNTVLKLWHPFVPYVTEAIWKKTYGADAFLMIASWPQAEGMVADCAEKFASLKALITYMRALRSQAGIAPGKELAAIAQPGDLQDFLMANKHIVLKLVRLSSFDLQDQVQKEGQMVGGVESGVEVYLDLTGAIDLEQECARIEKELANVEPYIAAQEKKLANSNFVDNAPEAVVNGEKEKLAEAIAKRDALKEQLNSYK